MTEAEWHAAEEPHEMLTFLDNRIFETEGEVESEDAAEWWAGRKLRLWAVACCRRIERLLTDKRSRAGLDALERYVDGKRGEKAFRTAIDKAARVTWEYSANAPGCECNAATAACSAMQDIQDEFTDAREAAGWVVDAVAAEVPDEQARAEDYAAIRAAEERAQAELVREVFGNPFRPVALAPAWLTSDVRALARAIYAERAWDRMPILADALQEAGCENEDVLAHCRSATAPHVRGCWVVDLLLGKGGPVTVA
jgi:hypothetical protein